MRAEEIRDLFSGACDGELSEAERQSFERALVEDPELRAEYDDFCEFVRDTAALASDEFLIPQVDLLPAVQRKISERSRGRYYRGRGSHKPSDQFMTVLIIALIMVCVAVAIWLGMSIIGGDLPPADVSPEAGTDQAEVSDAMSAPDPPPSLGPE